MLNFCTNGLKDICEIGGIKSLQRHLSLQDQPMASGHRKIILQDREHHLGPGATKEVNRSNPLQFLHLIGQQAEHALFLDKKRSLRDSNGNWNQQNLRSLA